MGYILKVDKTKQQINFLNCDNIDKWIDTCQEVTKSYDVVAKDTNFIFEFTGDTCTFKQNGISVVATTSPYISPNSVRLTTCKLAFSKSSITNLILYPSTSAVTDMNGMFQYCSGLTSLDVISSFDTSRVGDMSFMFNGCSNLPSLDLSSFNTRNVTAMTAMFQNCSKLTSLDVSSFNTVTTLDMSYMFNYCSGLTSLDLSNFKTSNTTNMSDMFKGCTNLTSLDLSNWNTRNVTNTDFMFYGCDSLQTIYMRGCSQATIDKITSVKPSQAQIITE